MKLLSRILGFFRSFLLGLLTILSVFTVCSLIVWFLYKDKVLKIIDDKILNPKVILPVSGTGSMEPTLPKSKHENPKDRARDIVSNVEAIIYPNGFTFNNKRYYLAEIERGDIVSVQNEKVKEILSEDFGDVSSLGYLLKRVVGMPKDTIELRGGKVYLNNKVLDEPYIKTANSTFGGDFLKECQKLEIPEGMYFVMGDNRKESNDSRFNLGFVDTSAIKYFIPESLQKFQSLNKNYRDTSKDKDISNIIRVNLNEFINLLNENREKNNLKKYRINETLISSSKRRVEAIFKAEGIDRATYSMEKSMKDAGYLPVIRGEIPVLGYFSASELLANLESFQKSRDFILDPEFDEIGLTSLEGSIDNCPQVITVIHFGGYRPPNYDRSLVENYQRLLNSLREAEDSYKRIRGFSGFYNENKGLVEDIIKMFEARTAKLKPIVKKIEDNVWLTENEQDYLNNEDKKVQEELNKKIENLNKKVEEWNG